MTDEELVDLVCKGETDRFEELVQRHQDMVYTMARRHASTAGDAEDIAQEVFLKAFRNIGSFRREAQFSTWLYRIAYNMCVDWARRNRRAGAPAVAEELADERSDVEQEAIANSERAEIRNAAQGLAERYRSVVLMYYYDDYSYERIAKVLGIAPKSVETRLYRARRILRRALDRRHGGGTV